MIVYKYTNRIEILQNAALRFTQPDQLNDPLEANPNFVELIEDIKKHETAGRTPTESRKISDEIDKSAPQMIYEMLKDQNGNIGFLSLSRNPNNQLMLAHYADEHRGFVLGFDGNHSFFRRDNAQFTTGLREVIYTPARPVIPGNAGLSGIMLEVAGPFFFTKIDDWSYEEEMRVMRKLENADIKSTLSSGFDIYLFNFPPEALLEIILGLRTPETLKQEIAKLAATKYPHAALLETRLSPTGSDLDVVPYVIS
jgi:hypothetical protein